MEVKYEPIFGDQSLFDGAPENAEIAALYSPINGYTGEDIMKHFRCLNDAINYKCISRYSAKVAQRRIIPEPKRWTWEDKESGKMPEIGAQVITPYDNGGISTVIGYSPNGKYFFFENDNDVLRATIKESSPIETPEEKAQRERNEWAKKASQFIDDELDCVNIVGEHVMRRFYNALKSGELPMPGKE